MDNATDVARSAADIILLEPSLAAISQGVTEGRRTFANTLKYIRMGTSSNFGNMLSMAGAAFLLPFLPMTPGQILLNNLIYDASQTALPTDAVDPEVEAEPARWDIRGVERFMVVFGPISSLFDVRTFGLLLLILGSNERAFHTGWFIESLITELVIALVVRTRHVFFRSRPGKLLWISTLIFIGIALILPYLPFISVFGFIPLPAPLMLTMLGLTALYVLATELTKKYFYSRARNAIA